MMDSFKTPLRYPGGKRVLHDLVTKILRHNGLLDGVYVEPFAGGAGIAIELLLRERIREVYLNDADEHIYAFWYSIVNNAESFIKKIEKVNVTLEEWKKQKEIYSSPNDHSVFDLGFSTFFLNRCNRSGILGGRPIGGLNQTGRWKIDARFNKKNLIKRIEMIALYRERIHIYGLDAQVFLETEISKINDEKIFLYLDPPYYTMGGELYLNYYHHDDHVLLSNSINQLPYKWMLSYDDVSAIKEMYRERRSFSVSLYYRANERKEGKELLFLSDSVEIPAGLLLQ